MSKCHIEKTYYKYLIDLIDRDTNTISQFTRDVPESRQNLSRISRDLVSLRTVIEHMVSSIGSNNIDQPPDILKEHIPTLLRNCIPVLNDVYLKLKDPRISETYQAARWVLYVKVAMKKLHLDVEMHKSAFELALGLISCPLPAEILSFIRDCRQNQLSTTMDTNLILAELLWIEAQMLKLDTGIDDSSPNTMLHKFINDRITYAESDFDEYEYDYYDRSDLSSGGSVCNMYSSRGELDSLLDDALVGQSRTEETGWGFVKNYYHCLSTAPETVHSFYKEESQFVLGEDEEPATVCAGPESIKQKLHAADIRDVNVKLMTVDIMSSNPNTLIHVVGEMRTASRPAGKFSQTFVLAPWSGGHFVFNDVLRFSANDGSKVKKPDKKELDFYGTV